MKDIEKNEQIFMFYGKRTNAEYLIHNGFVSNQSNPYDTYLLKLGSINICLKIKIFYFSFLLKYFQKLIKHLKKNINFYNVMD
jgi:hypothetical protein